jgi:choline dehydrogenase-like flavoprotein
MEFDYIITGAGAAGCVLANRLSEDPSTSVLLVEAGGSDFHPLFHMPAGFARMTKGIASWGWSTIPQRNLGGRALWYTQAKVLGGGTTINAQVYTRGNSADYDSWANDEKCVGWSYSEVLPYFKRAEDNQRFADVYHGNGGPLGVSVPVNPLPISEAFLRAAQEYGIPYNPDFNGARQEGIGHYQVTVRNARRSSTATSYLKPIRHRRNLTIKIGTTVNRIVLENNRAIGVEVTEDSGGPVLVRCSREVLVTSGAIGSPRLLLLSGIGPADHLSDVRIKVVHDLPGVGSNLQDHFDIYAICECTGNHTYDNYAKWHRAFGAGLQYLLFRQGPVASTLFETGGFWFADQSASWPDMQFHLGLGSGIEAGVAQLKNPGVTLNSAFLRPRSRGSVRLAGADPNMAPLIDPNFWSEDYDCRISLEGLKMAREILRQPALRPFLMAERLPGPDINSISELAAYASKTGKTDHHPVGTCRMGIDSDAVVAPDLKLRGLEGIRVCDSSIMPRLNSSNTNAPTIMIGEKAADLVRGLRLPPAAVLPSGTRRSSHARECEEMHPH